MAILEDSDLLEFCIEISIGILFLGILMAISYYCKTRANTSVVVVGGNGASAEISPATVVEFGYDNVTLSKLPELPYSQEAKTGSGGDGECSICLTDFRDKERIRLLPQCGHVFHVTCVDEWLRRQTTCPMCRISVFPIPLAAAAALRIGRQSC